MKRFYQKFRLVIWFLFLLLAFGLFYEGFPLWKLDPPV